MCAGVCTWVHLWWSGGRGVLSLNSEEGHRQLMAASRESAEGVSQDTDKVWGRTFVVHLVHALMPTGVSAQGPTQAHLPSGVDTGPGVEQALLRGQGAHWGRGAGPHREGLCRMYRSFPCFRGAGCSAVHRPGGRSSPAQYESSVSLFVFLQPSGGNGDNQRGRAPVPLSRVTRAAWSWRPRSARAVQRG